MPWFRPQDKEHCHPRLPDGLTPSRVTVTLKDRLEMGVHLLAVLDADRVRLGDEFNRQGLVDAVLRRELAELAADCRRDPPRGLVTR